VIGTGHHRLSIGRLAQRRRMIARLAPSIPLVRRTVAIGVVSLFITRLAKVGNPPKAAAPRIHLKPLRAACDAQDSLRSTGQNRCAEVLVSAADLIRRAGGLWEPGARQWLIE
jgi:hypothetical protein